MSNALSALRLPFSVAVGTAVGAGVSGTITPGVQELINEANAKFPLKPPSYFMMAEGVAKGRVDPTWARGQANNQGISDDAFNHLVRIANIGPGLDVAYELWRRDLITDAAFTRAVTEEAIDDSWLDPLRGLKERLLSPPELANARQQQFIDDARMHEEGGKQGYNAERMDRLFDMAGLPPGVMDGLTMLRRGILTTDEYKTLVAEGHTKTKYTDALLALETPLLSPEVWAGLRLRGWKTAAESYAGGAGWGYTPEMMDNLYLNRGRPAAPGQMWTAAARKIDGPAGAPVNEEQFIKAIQESDIRPEYGPMLWAIRYLYPSLFQLNRLVTGGSITPEVGADWATKARYAPEVVDALLASWTGAAAGPAAPWAQRARGRLYTVAHNEYVSAGIDESQARAALTVVGAKGGEQDTVIAIWNDERAISRLELTPAEIRREYRKNIITQAEALAELQDRGMTPADANKYLTATGTVAPPPP